MYVWFAIKLVLVTQLLYKMQDSEIWLTLTLPLNFKSPKVRSDGAIELLRYLYMISLIGV